MKSWVSCCFTTAAQLEKMTGSINSHTYSMTSGKGGAPIAVPLKSLRVDWSRQALFAHIDQRPFATHELSIVRLGANHYRAAATLTEDKRQSAPSGLGSYDACLFELAPEDEASKLQVFLDGSMAPLPSGPIWQ